MVGLAGLFASAFVIGLSGAMAPGSLLAVGISESLRRGFWAGPLISLGHALLELVMVILLVSGLGQFLAYPRVLGVIGVTGGAMLLWLAWATWGTAARPQQLFRIDNGGGSLALASAGGVLHAEGCGRFSANCDLLRVVGAGIAASIANPYWILWWATIGTAYIATAVKYGAIGVGAFYCGHITSDFAWYSLVSWTVASGKKFINDRVYGTILHICSGFLLLLAIYFLQLGAKLMLGG